jgi:hypothetical protein
MLNQQVLHGGETAGGEDGGVQGGMGFFEPGPPDGRLAQVEGAGGIFALHGDLDGVLLDL